MMNNKEAGAVAAIDHVPLSYVSANFTYNTDNCVSNLNSIVPLGLVFNDFLVHYMIIIWSWWQVADLYGIRATLVDGGEIRGAGNAWICPEVFICLEKYTWLKILEVKSK